MKIREAVINDLDAVWGIFSQVIEEGATYVFDEGTQKADLHRLWFAPSMQTYVAVLQDQVVGTYVIKPNQSGRGRHIANCSYMVSSHFEGKGIGDALCKHSIETAKQLGYVGIQFNMVVSSNKAAIKLWNGTDSKLSARRLKVFATRPWD